MDNNPTVPAGGPGTPGRRQVRAPTTPRPSSPRSARVRYELDDREPLDPVLRLGLARRHPGDFALREVDLEPARDAPEQDETLPGAGLHLRPLDAGRLCERVDV